MFGSQNNVPITIRMILGEVGAKAQPILKICNHGLLIYRLEGCVSVKHDAKGLLLSAIFDPNPVIFLEHRWLHNSISDISG